MEEDKYKEVLKSTHTEEPPFKVRNQTVLGESPPSISKTELTDYLN